MCDAVFLAGVRYFSPAQTDVTPAIFIHIVLIPVVFQSQCIFILPPVMKEAAAVSLENSKGFFSLDDSQEHCDDSDDEQNMNNAPGMKTEIPDGPGDDSTAII